VQRADPTDRTARIERAVVTAEPERPASTRDGSDRAPGGHLGSGAVRGGIVTAGGTALRFAAGLAGTVLLARLLGPSAYGFAAVSVVLAGLAELVRSGGIASLVARAPRLDDAAATTLHLLNIAFGTALAATTALLAPGIAAALGFPADAALVVLLGVCFLPAAVASVPAALLVRNLRFGVLATAELAGAVLGVAAALTVALLGGGAVALAVQPLVFVVVVTVVVLVRCPWHPTRPARPGTLRHDLGFAANVTGVQVLTFLSRNVDRLVVSAAFGPTAAGLYAQATQLLVLPLEQLAAPLQRVAVPVLARSTDDRARLARHYRRFAGTTALLLWPVFAVLAVTADVVVAVLFGPEWSGSVPVFRVLVVAGLAQTVGYVTVWVFVATGQGTRQTVWALISRPLLVAACFVAVPFGMTGVAAVIAVVSLVFVVPAFLVAAPRAGLRLRDLFVPLGGPALVALAAGAAASVVVVLPALAPIPTLVLAALLSLVVAAGVVAALPPLRRDCRSIVTLARRRTTRGTA
jgi:PST family polysaccharide transporter